MNWERNGEIRLKGRDVHLIKEKDILKANKKERYYRLYLCTLCQGRMNLNDFVLSRYLVQVSGKYYAQDDVYCQSPLS